MPVSGWRLSEDISAIWDTHGAKNAYEIIINPDNRASPHPSRTISRDSFQSQDNGESITMRPAHKCVAALAFAATLFFGIFGSTVCQAQESGNSASNASLNSTETASKISSSADDDAISAILATAPAALGPNESSSLFISRPPASPPPPPQNQAAKIGIGAKISLLGIGLEAATTLSRKLNLRGGFNFFNYSRGFNNDGIHYDGALNFRSAEAHLDWYVLGGFHISPGVLFYNGNKITANASVPAGQTFTLGGTQYASDPTGLNPVSGNGELTWPKAAPSILAGFGNILPRSGRHFGFNFEVGGEYMGAPTTTLNLQGTACNTSTGVCANAATDPGIQSSIQSQEHKINHDLAPFKFFPQISLGFGVNF